MIRCLVALFIMIAAVSHGAGKTGAPRPNILYFYVDDMGWGAIGPNGQAERKAQGLPYVVTPNLDRLAAQGVNFTRSYGCTVCSPARSSQQTGFHQGHTFADRNDPDNAKKAIRADDVTMGDVLAKAGYATGYWGKWGYGGSKSQPDPEILNVQTLPTSHGYQYVVAELHHVRAHTFFQPTLWSAPAKPGAKGGLELIPNAMTRWQNNKRYSNEPALQNHPKYPVTAYCDDVYAFAALDFVRGQAQEYNKSGKPFFGLLAVQVPHAPFGEIEQLPEWDRDYRDLPFFSKLSGQAKQWAAMITRIDAHFGNILDALEDPNGDGDKSDSVADNTLVIFQSDNGGPKHPARNEFMANGGLSGSKGSIQEGGIRIPTLMRWPAKITRSSMIKIGTSSDRLLDVTDLLPTFCDLAGVATPVGIDGVSVAPTLTGEGVQRQRDFLIHETGRGQSIIRGRHKLVRSRKELQLFDLDKDQAEENDIAGKNPKLVKELEALMLGERVDEPKGFANTYHHWTGKKGGKMSTAGNWSDYRYTNEGLTYIEDKGAPQLSWVARIDGDRPATVDRDLDFLALELAGAKVAVRNDVRLTGRNEIRLKDRSVLRLSGGAIESLRWIDVAGGSSIVGTGTIDGTLLNSGTLHGSDVIDLRGSLQLSRTSSLMLDLRDSALVVHGEANLQGRLSVTGEEAGSDRIRLITAQSVLGRFDNENDEVRAPNGRRFRIEYRSKSVTLTAL